jgi:hypothetical protein
MFAAETLRLHGAKLMELSRKEFAPSERGGSVAGVHHASSCAIWQSERNRFFLSDTTLKKQSNSSFQERELLNLISRLRRRLSKTKT